MAKRVCLMQYLRYGETKTKRTDIDISLDDDAMNYYICRQNNSTEIKEHFELLTEESQGLPCLAVIHTQNGCICLEALIPDVSVPILGKGFDGKSAHDFRLKPSTPGQIRRSTLQLRPGEVFYVQDLCLTLLPEESHEYFVRSAADGVVPSYEAYSQHVSQIGESQARLTPSPQRSHRAATCLKTPEGRTCVTPDRTPLIQQMTVDALNGKEDSQEWPQDYEKRAVLGTLRTIGRHNEKRPQDQVDELVDLPLAAQATETSFSLDPISAKSQFLNLEEGTPESEVLNSVEETAEAHARNLVDEPVEEDTREMTGLQVDCVRELSMPRSSSPVHVLTRVELTPSKTLHNPEFRPKDNPQVGFSDDEDRHREKRRRLSPGSGHASAEESPDSLAGKSIAVVARSDDPVNDSVIDPRMEQHLPASSHTATSNPQTPTINHSLQGSPANSFGPASSLRSTRSAVREDSNPSTQECGMRILFASSTSVGDSKAFKKFLREHEVKTVQSFDDATCLCVGKGELKKTSKLISAVLLGLDIITDDWVTDSARLKKLQDTHAYLARDPQRESEWGIKLDEAIERGRRKVRVFEGRNIAFTTKLKKELGNTNFADLKEIAVCAGAKKVGTSLPKESSDSNATTLIIGSLDDNDTPALQEKRFFTKEMISLSVLRGHLDTESDEFLIEKEPPQRKGNKKRMR